MDAYTLLAGVSMNFAIAVESFGISLILAVKESDEAFKAKNLLEPPTSFKLSYCTKCIGKHIATKVQENVTLITCPEFNCKERLEPHSCKDIISGAVFYLWEISLCESLRPVSDRVLRGDQDKLLVQLAEKKKWKKCPGCKYYVERTMGCLHIICRCGSEFCYGCGATWSDTREAECKRV
ncbi:E3 ubiquitin-protein ligase dbl4-like [Papaver somniferum]|uniref:E3 ubiquitin-protein ligase dbl4-like n=1 Tax=Papaver somniferum TaxID=3469 RepID=UPI000E6FE494|nr:E3 ubiquitin-protein ligase dbl4-like [Papaver somniferum]